MKKSSFCKPCILLFAILFFVFFSGNAYSETLKAAMPNWAPFFTESKDGDYSGIGVDVLDEIVKRTGDSASYSLYPAARLLQKLDTGKIDLIIIDSPNWVKPERKSIVSFTNSIMPFQEFVYFLAAKYKDIKEPKDLNGLFVGHIFGYYYEPFEDLFKNEIINRETPGTDTSLLEMLKKKRVDAILIDPFAFNVARVKLRYDKELFKRGLQISNIELTSTIRKGKKDILPRFNKAIEEMKADGTIQKIVDKYTK